MGSRKGGREGRRAMLCRVRALINNAPLSQELHQSLRGKGLGLGTGVRRGER